MSAALRRGGKQRGDGGDVSWRQGDIGSPCGKVWTFWVRWVVICSWKAEMGSWGSRAVVWVWLTCRPERRGTQVSWQPVKGQRTIHRACGA